LVDACGAKTKVVGSSDIGAIKSFLLNKCPIFAKKTIQKKGQKTGHPSLIKRKKIQA
jgi:hypothetical protein